MTATPVVSDPTPSLANWRSALQELEQAGPWPGPRPLNAKDPETLLVGRDADREDFRREVDSHSLILLTGASGVGKTSLLEVGLAPRLRKSGYQVAVCRDWTGKADPSQPAAFLAEKVRGAFAGQDLGSLSPGPELFWDLEEEYGSRAVIVLDQFEELIRYAPGLREGMFDLLVELNLRTRLKIVVSFRIENLHELRPLENRAKPFTISSYTLEEIKEDFAEDVIETAGPGAVTDEAVRMIASQWRDARSAGQRMNRIDPFSRVGLLHLQALLYALHAEARGIVTAETVQGLQLDPLTGARSTRPGDLFLSGLQRSISVKLERCRHASLGLNQYLIEGATQTLARSVRHLSSAGFKLVRDSVDLAESTIGPELGTLQNGIRRAAETPETGGDDVLEEGQFNAMFELLMESIQSDDPSIDLLRTNTGRIAELADARLSTETRRSWVRRLHEDLLPVEADPAETTAGPLLGQAPAVALIEELRRFALALAWLKETSLIRVSSPGEAGTMVSLIHDGFGEALQRWSIGEMQRPTAALHAVTAPGGAVFLWPPKRFKIPRILPNLRWKGSWTEATFEHTIFLNCDLRGTFFANCDFTGVTFVNCLLDGVVFSDCRIHGGFQPATGDWSTKKPVFLVPTDDNDQLQAFAHYQPVGAPLPAFFSPLPGLPSRPATERDPAGTPWTEESGGLLVYGGRISSLLIRSCRFTDLGGISFRHVAGSGLEVAEQAEGRYELFGSSVRHFSVTSDSDTPGPGFDIILAGSAMSQMWLGDTVRGSVEAVDCKLVQVWNASGLLDFQAKNSKVHGLINVGLDSDCLWMEGMPAGFSSADIDPNNEFALDSRRMNYLRRPALES